MHQTHHVWLYLNESIGYHKIIKVLLIFYGKYGKYYIFSCHELPKKSQNCITSQSFMGSLKWKRSQNLNRSDIIAKTLTTLRYCHLTKALTFLLKSD